MAGADGLRGFARPRARVHHHLGDRLANCPVSSVYLPSSLAWRYGQGRPRERRSPRYHRAPGF
ncbi:hypothetical protein CRV15_14375 [Streptomyces clavuligerus]|uniref:Uncharacterized protein n=1 Tax=Streptomyces clavuligerus TaxID=1901 RepID=B5GWJ4_STRCL|nr:hypothetical protein D1794_15025 [Streptomyces clavuligerus]EDY50690.1 hypothetical protein SSCG_03700 [Streptomyces clavuligerus]EFG07898.1 Hypothetical protein SCLAV_2825 [Streptomyces clavuligerus]QCS06704.1 hypothetical protein CRV15_14375 [Streptomyces clavuligerus]QPJ93945.1 hypothetical protein GE265_13640 [Streptomyces clavuligerus]